MLVRGLCPFSSIFGPDTPARPVSADNIAYEHVNRPLDISITAHAGFTRGLLRVVGRGNYGLPTGGMRVFRKMFLCDLLLLLGVIAIVIKRTVS